MNPRIILCCLLHAAFVAACCPPQRDGTPTHGVWPFCYADKPPRTENGPVPPQSGTRARPQPGSGQQNPERHPLPNDLVENIRLFHYNDKMNADVPFVVNGTLAAGRTYQMGHPLSWSQRDRLTSSLRAHQPPSGKIFCPQDAIVYFNSDRTPYFCVEISTKGGLAQAVDLKNGGRVELKDPSAAIDAAEHPAHR